MSVHILRRERAANGWLRYWGDVNGHKVGIRLPAQYVESVSEAEAETEVRQSLKEEYERLREAESSR